MIEDTIRDLAEGIAGTKHKIYGVVTGEVIDPLDEVCLGRVRVRVSTIDSSDLVAWARVATPMAGALSGAYFIPSIGDQVLLAFEHGDVGAPYIIGSLWTALSPPPIPSPLLETRVIRTPLGNQIGFREAPPAITITTPDMTPSAIGMPSGVTIASNIMITLMCGATSIILTPAGVTISAPSVSVVSAGVLSQQAASLSLRSAGPAMFKSETSISVNAPIVTIN